MNQDTCDINIRLTEDIIEQLKLDQDEAIQKQLALVHIEFDARKINRRDKTSREVALLLEISESKISQKLVDILRDALGYYAIVEQAEGTNEPPIGPMFAQQLLDKVSSKETELSFIRDELFQIMENKVLK